MRVLWFVSFLAAATPSFAAQQPAPAASAAVREGQAAFTARCRVDYARRYPGAPGADVECQERWRRAGAAGPAADVILSLAGQSIDVAGARARFAGAAWQPRAAGGDLATGRFGLWSVAIRGKAGVEDLDFRWDKVGDFSPFDVPEALRIRGARLTEVACLGFGPSEQTHVFRVETPGRPPFGLTLYDRTAPTANANSSYVATASIRAPAPSLAALRRGPDGAEWQARCD